MKTLLIALILFSTAVFAESRPEPILPSVLDWRSPPDNARVKGAWIVGSEKGEGLYIFRVSLNEGGKIPPHTHPDTRHSTVMEGTLYVGFGNNFDENTLVAVPEGAVYTASANTPHFLYAKDGDVIYEETGIGPTSVTPIEE